MSILLTILGVITGVIVLVLIIAAFVKADYAIQREITIAKDVPVVYDYIKYLKNQDNYSKWVLMDPDMKKEYFGTDGTVGFKSAWDSQDKNVGKGDQQIVGLTPNQKVNYHIHFIKPFDGLADAEISTTAAAANQTLVKWGFQSKMKYPMNFMLLFMNMEKMIGTDLEIGLTNLKNVLEK